MRNEPAGRVSRRVRRRRTVLAVAIACVLLAGLVVAVVRHRAPTRSAAHRPAPPVAAACGRSTVGPTGLRHPGVAMPSCRSATADAALAALAVPWTARLQTAGVSAVGVDGAYPAPAGDRQSYRSPGYVAHPGADLGDCDTGRTCAAFYDDALAAYANTLDFYYAAPSASDRAAHGRCAVAILNRWARTLRSYDDRNNQTRLVVSWAADAFARAAEILRYSYTPATGHADLQVGPITQMVRRVLVPALTDARAADVFAVSNGNWDLARQTALAEIAIFVDDQRLLRTALTGWQARVRAYIYTAVDGARPPALAGPAGSGAAQSQDCAWFAPNDYPACVAGRSPPPAGARYADGLTQETCRDLSHTVAGLAAAVQLAETARRQGVDLYAGSDYRGHNYPGQLARLTVAVEQNAAWTADALGAGSLVIPCGTGAHLSLGGTGYRYGWRLIVASLARRGAQLTNARTLLTRYLDR